MAVAHPDWAPAIIAQRFTIWTQTLEEGRSYDVVNVEQDARYREFWQTYHPHDRAQRCRCKLAKIEMRRRLSLIGAMMLHTGQVDGLIWHLGNTHLHLKYIDQSSIARLPAARGSGKAAGDTCMRVL